MWRVFFPKATATGSRPPWLRFSDRIKQVRSRGMKTSFNDPLEIFIVHRVREKREKERESAHSLHGMHPIQILPDL